MNDRPLHIIQLPMDLQMLSAALLGTALDYEQRFGGPKLTTDHIRVEDRPAWGRCLVVYEKPPPAGGIGAHKTPPGGGGAHNMRADVTPAPGLRALAAVPGPDRSSRPTPRDLARFRRPPRDAT